MGYQTTKAQALAAANNLARRCGDGYEPKVWENFGWHYSAKKGPITVREDIIVNPEYEGYPARYDASIEPGKGVGFTGGHMSLGVQIFAKGETPKEAIEAVLRARDVDCLKLEEIAAILWNVE